jgi:hypothetical protein
LRRILLLFQNRSMSMPNRGKGRSSQY